MAQALGAPLLPPAGMPYLDVLGPDVHGRRIPLVRETLLLGSAPTCDVCFDDPELSPAHAAIRRVDGAVVVEDLGSQLGTFLNGVALTGPGELHAGDVLTLGEVRLRYGEAPPADAGAGAAEAAPEDPLALFADAAPTTMEPEVYAELVAQHRERLLARVALWRRRSRRLFWVGAVLFAVGCAFFTLGVLAFLGWTGGLLDRVPRPPDIFGWDVAGVALTGHLAWAVGLLGLLAMLLGLVIHVLARGRARRIDKTIPPPPTGWHLQPNA
jgi:hypothetical protein